MNTSPFPERSIFEYIISIYLPGSLIAIVFLYAIESNDLVQEFANKVPSVTFITDGSSETDDLPPNIKTEDYRGNLLLALYTFYFISTPFIFGALADGLRHCISDSCKKIPFFKWNYPRSTGYSYSKKKYELSENIYSRQLDKSYLLYHAYEFYGNFISAISIGFFIYAFNSISINCQAFGSKYILFLILIVISTFFLCGISMRHFWKENKKLGDDWGLYGEEIIIEQDTQSTCASSWFKKCSEFCESFPYIFFVVLFFVVLFFVVLVSFIANCW